MSYTAKYYSPAARAVASPHPATDKVNKQESSEDDFPDCLSSKDYVHLWKSWGGIKFFQREKSDWLEGTGNGGCPAEDINAHHPPTQFFK